MSKHTLGPWSITVAPKNFGPVDGFAPFGACGCCNSPWMNGESQDEQNANAALICAAPEMLEALKLGLKYLETKRQAEDLGDPDRFLFAQSLSAAITKAEGRES